MILLIDTMTLPESSFKFLHNPRMPLSPPEAFYTKPAEKLVRPAQWQEGKLPFQAASYIIIAGQIQIPAVFASDNVGQNKTQLDLQIPD